ncbi:HAD family hydrolase [Sphaerisporangium corydalis]|uniref:HAD family hydrolase n=1 Tax=Sphaerisporangium corydalis TaxID=1441875 RepID=A0ABV9ETD5_9ACTN|nr:HAD-IB family hydrolase [Sphaerisporangium corydalis]
MIGSRLPPRVAFFDVDETLLAAKSMVEFLRSWLGHDDAAFRATVAQLGAVAEREGRAAANRAYYRLFAGVSSTALAEAGGRWYARHRRRPDAFVGATATALAGHRAAGDLVVLVSGSCHAVLDPLAADVGGDEVLCTELVVAAGRLTGEVARSMIGPAKSEAAAGLLRGLGACPADCFAYGDHASDLDLLTAVGNPRVVGDDPVLAAWAGRHGWPVLPAQARPRPVLRA